MDNVSWCAIGASVSAELLAAVGVLATLVFLAGHEFVDRQNSRTKFNGGSSIAVSNEMPRCETFGFS